MSSHGSIVCVVLWLLPSLALIAPASALLAFLSPLTAHDAGAKQRKRIGQPLPGQKIRPDLRKLRPGPTLENSPLAIDPGMGSWPAGV
mmetsp:Transcript_76524/g.147760  ORF Transcript_76524/g.147760 Transcript_76524/m.147760 type:complete len:88 (-) Transcript_76524:628-891(-)